MSPAFRKVLSISIILINIYFLWCTFVILKDGGGPMGFGIMILPITLSINLLLIPAIMDLNKRRKGSFSTIINSFGLIWALFWLIFFLQPK